MYHVVFHNLDHLVFVALHATGYGPDYPFEHQQILDLGHLGHIDVTASQILDLALGAPVAVDDTPRFEVVYLLQVGKGPGRLNHLVATTQRLHDILGEDIGIELHVDTARVGPLDKEHRLAATQDIEIHALGEGVIVVNKFVVPRQMLGIERAHPDAGTLDPRGGKVDVVREIDKCTILAQALDGVPQRFQDGVMQIKFRVLDQNHGIGHGIEHSGNIIKHSLLARTQPQRIEGFGVFTLDKQLTLGPQHLVLGEYALPQPLHPVETGFGQVDMPPFLYLELVAEQVAELLAQQQEEQLVKLGRSLFRDIMRSIDGLFVLRLNRAGPHLVRRHQAQRLLCREPKGVLLDLTGNLYTKATLASTIGTNHGHGTRRQLFARRTVAFLREQYFHGSTF